MNIVVNKAELLATVKELLPFVKRKTTIPILANLCFVASAETVAITATDLNSSLTVNRTWNVKSEGTITIPTRKLADVLAKLKTIDADEVTIQAIANNWVTLSCGSLTVEIPGMSSKNFPNLPKFPTVDASTIPASVLAGLIHRTHYAISAEESRYTLHGSLLTIDENGIRMVSTDGHRLAVAEHGGNFGKSLRTLIVKDAINHIRRLVLDKTNQGQSITVARDEECIHLAGANWHFRARHLTGQFPNWERVMPKNNRITLTLPGAKLRETLARVAPFADEHSKAVKWELVAGKGLKLSASSTMSGEASEMISTNCEDSQCIGLSAAYVDDMLATLEKGQDVVFAMRDEKSAAMWTPVEANGYTTRSVVMPVRL